jgi:hypothetical protein
MTDALDGVRDHYRATGLTARLKTALAVLGPEDDRLTRPSNSPPSDSLVELAIAIRSSAHLEVQNSFLMTPLPHRQANTPSTIRA